MSDVRAAAEVDQQTVIVWLDGQIAETERCIEARRQAEATWNGGDSRTWKAVGCELTKAGRVAVAEREGRIADKYRHDLECLLTLRRHLAEHPADSELAIDEAWLRSVGGYSNGSYWYFPGESDSSVDLVKWAGGWNFRIHDGHNCKTRGDVRRLAAALGIELKERTER